MNTRSLVVVASLALLMAACGGGGSGVGEICLLCFDNPPKINFKPTIRATVGADQFVVEGDTVVLAAGASPAFGCKARHEWRQTQGPNVGINGSSDLQQRFTAPAVGTTTTLGFKLRAWCSGTDRKDDASMSVTVEPTSATALCASVVTYTTTYVWTKNGCTGNSANLVGDVRIVTLYRQTEAESNDSAGSANALTFPARLAGERLATDVGGSVTGFGDQDDYYVISPPVTGLYEINLCNDPFACLRGTVTEHWAVSLLDQDMEVIVATNENKVDEQTLWIDLDAGLPYYLRVHAESESSHWNYNLTVLSEGG